MTKKLEDLTDVKRYLAEDCYCPGEIYSTDGFFFQVFKPGDECGILAEGDMITDEDVYPSTVVSAGGQVVVFFYDAKRSTVLDAVRFDATENNIAYFKERLGGIRSGRRLDEYEPGATARGLKEIMSLADGVMLS